MNVLDLGWACEDDDVNQRLQRDAALGMMMHCIELLSDVLDEEQQQQAREGIYAICLYGIEAYEVHVNRMHKRLKPLDN